MFVIHVILIIDFFIIQIFFCQDEKLNLFKCIASILHLGNLKLNEEQSAIDGDLGKISALLGIDEEYFRNALIAGKIKVIIKLLMNFSIGNNK